MQIVINIPEIFYEALRKTDVIINGRRNGKTLTSVIFNAVANGTPLSKRWIDADKAIDLLNQKIDEHDKMMAKYEPYQNTQIPNWMWEGVVSQSTIIETDKAESEVEDGKE